MSIATQPDHTVQTDDHANGSVHEFSKQSEPHHADVMSSHMCMHLRMCMPKWRAHSQRMHELN